MLRASQMEPTFQCRRHRGSGSTPGFRRPPGGGNANPHQCSCLENPMDRGAWGPTVHRVTKRQRGAQSVNVQSAPRPTLCSPQRRPERSLPVTATSEGTGWVHQGAENWLSGWLNPDDTLAMPTGEGTSGEQTVPEMEQRHKNKQRPEEPRSVLLQRVRRRHCKGWLKVRSDFWN